MAKNANSANQVEAKLVYTRASPQEEQQLNVWIPKDLMKRLKVRGVEADKSLKEMVTEALEQFL
ncbi:hypothetical protein IC229_04260 [Spirosoma sp. BT702]|uniref:CopG family transcriptional regulator n=1 Tax=Spirosoma profusum TaxID=2771354 RepID=A0A927AQ85_9BACT|nr:hypothetical protein [Spirosoma profusum]MBD2699836.1 hypothetical protein [Spirosoma profusum]